MILNLAVWFGWRVILPGGSWASVDLLALGLSATAFVALRYFRVNVIAVVVASGLLGVLATWF